MAFNVELDPETEARLAAEAQARGVSLETYVQNLVERAAWTGVQPAEGNERRRQAVRAMLEFADKYHFTLGEGVSIKGLIHEGHKY